MTRRLLCLILLLRGASAELVLPVAPHAATDETRNPHVSVILTKTGLIQIEPRRFLFSPNDKKLPAREQLSLDGLSDRLGQAKRAFNVNQKRQGRSGYSDWRRTSKLVVGLSVDKDVPALHVQWLLAMFVEQRFFKLSVTALTSASQSYTPDEARSLGTETERNPRIGRLAVVIPEGMPPKGSTVLSVARTTGKNGAKYAVGGKRIQLAKLSEFFKTSKPPGVRIQLSAAVPFKYVVAVLDRIHAADIAVPIWIAKRIPSEDQRAAKELPIPK